MDSSRRTWLFWSGRHAERKVRRRTELGLSCYEVTARQTFNMGDRRGYSGCPRHKGIVPVLGGLYRDPAGRELKDDHAMEGC